MKNVIKRTKTYVSVSEVVYPRYSLIDVIDCALSGFKEHSVHLYIGFGTPGAIRHGTIGIKIETINAAVEIMPEYINLFFNCIF